MNALWWCRQAFEGRAPGRFRSGRSGRERSGRESGAAILTAMLTVVLVSTLAAGALWWQWRSIELESARRTRLQSAWVLTGALDWARLILREDGRKGGGDHLAEPWAVPLEPARLSTFLASDRSDVLDADAQQSAFLSGSITDQQARLNVANLALDGKLDPAGLRAFARLFDLLGLPSIELSRLADAVMRTRPARDVGGASSEPVPLWPQDVEQLSWLGLSSRAVDALRPFVVVLPTRTPVNLNTAPPEVVYACLEGLDMADAHRLVRDRTAQPWATLEDAGRAVGTARSPLVAEQHSVSSRYFEVRGRLQLDGHTVEERSLVQRDGLEVRILWRHRGPLAAVALLQ